MSLHLRQFSPADHSVVNTIAVAAFSEYRDHYTDWPTVVLRIGEMAALAESGEIIVAEHAGQVVGAVAYLGPSAPKADFFEPAWAVMRLLVVSPAARGLGVGKALAQACLTRAREDAATIFALHTSTMMQVALPMYERMGFTYLRSAPPIHGVAYGVYVKPLNQERTI